jgi:hypothetical protein
MKHIGIPSFPLILLTNYNDFVQYSSPSLSEISLYLNHVQVPLFFMHQLEISRIKSFRSIFKIFHTNWLII